MLDSQYFVWNVVSKDQRISGTLHNSRVQFRDFVFSIRFYRERIEFWARFFILLLSNVCINFIYCTFIIYYVHFYLFAWYCIILVLPVAASQCCYQRGILSLTTRLLSSSYWVSAMFLVNLTVCLSLVLVLNFICIYFIFANCHLPLL